MKRTMKQQKMRDKIINKEKYNSKCRRGNEVRVYAIRCMICTLHEEKYCLSHCKINHAAAKGKNHGGMQTDGGGFA